jgi:hypothetical protein
LFRIWFAVKRTLLSSPTIAIAAEITTEIVIMPGIHRLQKWSPRLDLKNFIRAIGSICTTFGNCRGSGLNQIKKMLKIKFNANVAKKTIQLTIFQLF